MSVFELVLVIGAIVAPVAALLFVLPKLKKKKTFETTEYVPEKKEETVIETPKPVEVPKDEPKVEFKNPFEWSGKELENYREYLMRKRDQLSSPVKNELPKGFNPNTEDYFSYRRRKKKESEPQNQDIHSLSPEIKALLIAGILDRKF